MAADRSCGVLEVKCAGLQVLFSTYNETCALSSGFYFLQQFWVPSNVERKAPEVPADALPSRTPRLPDPALSVTTNLQGHVVIAQGAERAHGPLRAVHPCLDSWWWHRPAVWPQARCARCPTRPEMHALVTLVNLLPRNPHPGRPIGRSPPTRSTPRSLGLTRPRTALRCPTLSSVPLRRSVLCVGPGRVPARGRVGGPRLIMNASEK